MLVQNARGHRCHRQHWPVSRRAEAVGFDFLRLCRFTSAKDEQANEVGVADLWRVGARVTAASCNCQAVEIASPAADMLEPGGRSGLPSQPQMKTTRIGGSTRTYSPTTIW